MEGKTARGASSPAKPALHMPEPLSTTRAEMSSSISEEGQDLVKTGSSETMLMLTPPPETQSPTLTETQSPTLVLTETQSPG